MKEVLKTVTVLTLRYFLHLFSLLLKPTQVKRHVRLANCVTYNGLLHFRLNQQLINFRRKIFPIQIHISNHTVSINQKIPWQNIDCKNI